MSITELIVWYLVFLFSTTCHEAAHAYMALRGGDRTAYLGGHVTLDPTPHIKRSPIGMVMMPLFGPLLMGSSTMIGWASVPIDPHWARAHPGRAAVMSLAGPATNFLLALIALVVFKILIESGVFESFDPRSPIGALKMVLEVMLFLNILLGIFNLIPFPPLDGAGVAEGLFPNTFGAFYDRLRETPMLSILGVIAIAFFVLPHLVEPVFLLAQKVLYA